MRLHQIIQKPLQRWGLEVRKTRLPYPEISDTDRRLMAEYAPYTMTSEARQWSMLSAVRHVDAAGVSGDIVECGVWKGGLVMLAKAGRGILPSINRNFYLFDTFAGMTRPSKDDLNPFGEPPEQDYDAQWKGDHSEWCYASLKEVQTNFHRTGLMDETVIFREGDVAATLRAPPLPESIAVLRLDTDWYESTKIELEVLYPLLSSGGILILDDYGCWLGQRKAVDEYFAGHPLMMWPVDWTCRAAVKT